MMWIESVSVGLFFIITIKLIQLLRKHFEMLKVIGDMPGPHGLEIVLKPKIGPNILFEFFTSSLKVFGSPFRFWFGPAALVVVIGSPSEMKSVLNSKNALDKAFIYEFFNLGKGLLVSSGNLWRKDRKIFAHAFNKKMLEDSIPVVREKAEKLVQCLNDKAGKEEFDISDNIIDCTVDTIFETVFDMETDKSLRDRYKHDVER
jgi:cytochrome P450